jgi:Cu(I)/Ag(I) efflux system membrane fusion protein
MKAILQLAALAAVAALAAYGGYRYAGQGGMAGAPGAQKDGRKPLYYHDPMFPQHRFDKPGKSPFMDMQLVPVYADAAGGAAPGIAVSATASQNLGVRTVAAESGTLEPALRAVGSVAWNERGIVILQARAAGFIERLHARAPLDPVAKGAPLVEILVPEWAAAQEEYLLLRASASAELKAIAPAARRRLVLLGMSEAQIAQVESEARVRDRFTLHSPIGGVIAELGVREGMTVQPGATLFRLAELASVWVNAEIPEVQASWLRPGAAAEARVPAWPERVFKGRVGAILPELNAEARTARARIELANPGGVLKPGMFAEIAISGGRGRPVVLVPAEAVIRTGERNVVIVAQGGRFVPVEVEVGAEAGGRSEILKGVKTGEHVVASGQFLIDSEASLKGALARLGAAAPGGAGGLHAGEGRVTDLDAAAGRVELDHGPMQSIQWPAMQMGFKVADPARLRGLAKGDVIEFGMRGEPDKEGDYVIETLKKKGAP